MILPPHLRAVAQACVDDLDRVQGLLRRAEEIEWVSDAAALYAARLADASRMVARVHARARSAERAVIHLAAGE